MRGWGAAKYKKNLHVREIKWLKIHAHQLNLKNIHAMAWKKFIQGFDKEKKFLQLENSSPLPPPPPPPPSITFLMVRPYGRWFQKIEPAVSSSCFVYIYILGICVFYSYPQVKVAKPSVTDEKLNIISLD